MVDINYPYNAIFGRNTLVKFAAVIHQSYLSMTLPSAGGVITVFGNQEDAKTMHLVLTRVSMLLKHQKRKLWLQSAKTHKSQDDISSRAHEESTFV